MISVAEIVVGVRGAGRLALRDENGFSYFDASVQGFWRSCVAVFLAYPVYLLAVGLRPELPTGAAVIAVETIGYVINWFAFALAMFHLTEFIGKADRYLRYIVAVNWCNVISALVVGFATLLGALGLLPEGVARFVSLVAFLWTIGFSWYVARHGLEVPGLTAAGIVALDVFISFFVLSVMQTIEGV